MQVQPADGRPGSPGRSGRPVDHSRDAEILAVTLDVLAEQGYERLTLDGVAQRVGRAKTTLYRRWPTKLDLVVAAVHGAGPPPELHRLPDTGSLRSDLLAVLDSPWLGGAERRPVLLDGLAAATRVADELAVAVRRTVTEPYAEVWERLLRRALQRGEIPTEVGPRLVVVAQVFPAMAIHTWGGHRGRAGRELLVAVIDDVVLPSIGWPT